MEYNFFEEDFSREDMSLLEKDLKKHYNLVCHAFFDDRLPFLEIIDKIFRILRLLNFGEVYELKEEIPKKIAWLAGFSGRWDLFLVFYERISYDEVFPDSAYDRYRSLGEFYWKNGIFLFAVSGAIKNNQKAFFDCFIDLFNEKDEYEPYNHLSKFNRRDDDVKNSIQNCSQEMIDHILSCENEDFKEYVQSFLRLINQEYFDY